MFIDKCKSHTEPSTVVIILLFLVRFEKAFGALDVPINIRTRVGPVAAYDNTHVPELLLLPLLFVFFVDWKNTA